eukprot:574154-Alexandrium_andersonii.AAC.2
MDIAPTLRRGGPGRRDDLCFPKAAVAGAPELPNNRLVTMAMALVVIDQKRRRAPVRAAFQRLTQSTTSGSPFCLPACLCSRVLASL